MVVGSVSIVLIFVFCCVLVIDFGSPLSGQWQNPKIEGCIYTFERVGEDYRFEVLAEELVINRMKTENMKKGKDKETLEGKFVSLW